MRRLARQRSMADALGDQVILSDDADAYPTYGFNVSVGRISASVIRRAVLFPQRLLSLAYHVLNGEAKEREELVGRG